VPHKIAAKNLSKKKLPKKFYKKKKKKKKSNNKKYVALKLGGTTGRPWSTRAT
jgi:hypothetical protein